MKNNSEQYQYLFGHVAVGQDAAVLSEIRSDPNVNGVLQENAVSTEVQTYLGSLKRDDLSCAKPWSEAEVYNDVGKDIIFIKGETSLADVENILRGGFPEQEGFSDFAQDVFQTLNDFCDATGYREVESGFVVSLPDSGQIWHRDNETDVRGFKAYLSKGPFLRANDTVKVEPVSFNYYGCLDPSPQTEDPHHSAYHAQLPQDKIAQMDEGSFGIWKGDVHEHPLIHVKPRTLEEEFRLSMMINPTPQAYEAKLKEEEWTSFYQQPDFS